MRSVALRRADAPVRPAVTLLSGGLDSTTTMAIARRDGFDCFALTIDYGQRHRVELDAARAVAERLGARDHAIVPLDLRMSADARKDSLTDAPHRFRNVVHGRRSSRSTCGASGARR